MAVSLGDEWAGWDDSLDGPSRRGRGKVPGRGFPPAGEQRYRFSITLGMPWENRLR